MGLPETEGRSQRLMTSALMRTRPYAGVNGGRRTADGAEVQWTADAGRRTVKSRSNRMGFRIPTPGASLLHCPPSAVHRSPCSYEFLALAAELNRACLGHLTYDREDLLLRRFNFRQSHGTFRFEIILQHLGRTLRHVLEDLF